MHGDATDLRGSLDRSAGTRSRPVSGTQRPIVDPAPEPGANALRLLGRVRGAGWFAGSRTAGGACLQRRRHAPACRHPQGTRGEIGADRASSRPRRQETRGLAPFGYQVVRVAVSKVGGDGTRERACDFGFCRSLLLSVPLCLCGSTCLLCASAVRIRPPLIRSSATRSCAWRCWFAG